MPTIAILCAELWVWYCLAIISGELGIESQEVMIVTMQVAAMTNSLALGF